jgi:hypothetical protein
MIEIKGTRFWCSACNHRGEDGSNREIRIGINKNSGMAITLCHVCRNELIEKLKESESNVPQTN